MRNNRTARFNSNNAAVIGPRQLAIIAVLSRAKSASKSNLSISEIAKAFQLRGDANAKTLRTTVKSLMRKGLVSEVTKDAKPTADGFFVGLTYTTTAAGTRLANRMAQVEGLGRTFGLVRCAHAPSSRRIRKAPKAA